MNRSNFIQTIAPMIVAEGKKRGYSVFSGAIAQAVIESNFGESGLAQYNNFFGLKCGGRWKGKSVNMKTKEEYEVGTLTTIKDNFRAYDSVEAGVAGYYDFINTKRYVNLKTATTAIEYCTYLKADGYATSSKYVDTLMNCINKYGLLKYDGIEVVSRPTPKKSIEDVAVEVIAGKWGNGLDRKNRLHAAGYDYATVQAKVNSMRKSLRGE